LISSFDIWLVRDRPLWFFHAWCLWSNNPCHKFEKSTLINIFLWLIFFFQFHCSISFFKRLTLWFFSNFFILDYLYLNTRATSFMSQPQLARSLLFMLQIYHATSGWLEMVFLFIFIQLCTFKFLFIQVIVMFLF
jgi:hypothetical protein